MTSFNKTKQVKNGCFWKVWNYQTNNRGYKQKSRFVFCLLGGKQRKEKDRKKQVDVNRERETRHSLRSDTGACMYISTGNFLLLLPLIKYIREKHLDHVCDFKKHWSQCETHHNYLHATCFVCFFVLIYKGCTS